MVTVFSHSNRKVSKALVFVVLGMEHRVLSMLCKHSTNLPKFKEKKREIVQVYSQKNWWRVETVTLQPLASAPQHIVGGFC